MVINIMANNNISLLQTSVETRLKVLKKLGFTIDNEGYVIDSKTQEILKCVYGDDSVHIESAAILPGSTLIINANLLTMSQYFLEHEQ